MNGSGVRDISRVLKVSTTTVINTLKKACNLIKVNWKLLQSIPNVILMPLAMELDEQWSFVQSKKQQRWLWLAICHKIKSERLHVIGLFINKYEFGRNV